MRLTLMALLIPFVLSAPVLAADFYVAPDGKNTNPGTLSEPFESITRAQEAVSPGDTVYLRGGTYKMRMDQITRRSGIYSYVFDINKSGTANAPITYTAYKSETPIFDFSNVKPDTRITAFYLAADYIHFKSFEVTGVQVTLKPHTQSECFQIHGGHNVLEQLSLHDGMAIGVYILSGADNLILNCDAYRNWDYFSEEGRGGNTDGFGCHPSKGGTGNVFRGCRSWFNSDDGYDCINSAESVMFDHCWAFYNGFSTEFKSLGDGNGFKAGGYGSRTPDRLPNPIPRNTVQFCLSVRNKNSGFYANHHVGGANWINDSAYGNGINFNMLNRLMDNRTDIPGIGQFMRNNLGFKGGKELSNLNVERSDVVNNYFNLDVKVSESDFESLDQSQLTRPRQADGSLPEITFMHLTKSSPLRGLGIPIKSGEGKSNLGAF